MFVIKIVHNFDLSIIFNPPIGHKRSRYRVGKNALKLETCFVLFLDHKCIELRGSNTDLLICEAIF